MPLVSSGIPFTEVKQVSITIGGQPFEHLLYHYRLAYSGWQYVQVIQGGESFVALSEGCKMRFRPVEMSLSNTAPIA